MAMKIMMMEVCLKMGLWYAKHILFIMKRILLYCRQTAYKRSRKSRMICQNACRGYQPDCIIDGKEYEIEESNYPDSYYSIVRTDGYGVPIIILANGTAIWRTCAY